MASLNAEPDEVTFELEENNNGTVNTNLHQCSPRLQVEKPYAKPLVNGIYEELPYVHQPKPDHGDINRNEGSMKSWKIAVIALSVAVVVLSVSDMFSNYSS